MLPSAAWPPTTSAFTTSSATSGSGAPTSSGTTPWKAAKEPGKEQQVATTLYTSCESLRCIGLLLAPFLPNTAATILERIGLPDALASARLPDDVRTFGVLPVGTPTTVGAALFPRIQLPDAEAK